MADIAGTTIGAISLGIEVSKILYRFGTDYKEADRETSWLRQSNDDFRLVLARVQRIMDTHINISHDNKVLAISLITRAENMLAEIYRDLDKLQLSASKASISNIARKMRWTMSKENTLNLVDRLGSVSRTLQTMLDVIQLSVPPFPACPCLAHANSAVSVDMRRARPRKDFVTGIYS
jgi:vacuolar-type H+-ATPase catalytic subunit A/Vma1